MRKYKPVDQTVDLDTARKLILRVQGLFPPRIRRGKVGVKSFLAEVGTIQFDPINIVGRNPDLVLQSRVKNYRSEMLDELLYQDRALVDGWDKMASIYPVGDWPLFHHHRMRMEDRFGIPNQVVMELAPDVLDQIRREGPQSSLDFDHVRKTEWAWGPTRVSRAALEGLYKMGHLGVHHRVNNRRYFDLIQNLLPEDVLNRGNPHPDLESYQRWHVMRRVRSLGLAHPGAGEHWGGILDLKTAARRELLDQLDREGSLASVEIDGIPGKRFYTYPESLIKSGEMGLQDPAAAIIAPLDNLLWDRRGLKWIFDFEYVWEVYKPAEKRMYGYYVLPVLYGDRFCARFEPGWDSEERILTVKNWWWEDGIEISEPLRSALRDCFRDFGSYLGAADIRLAPDINQVSDLDWLQELI